MCLWCFVMPASGMSTALRVSQLAGKPAEGHFYHFYPLPQGDLHVNIFSCHRHLITVFAHCVCVHVCLSKETYCYKCLPQLDSHKTTIYFVVQSLSSLSSWSYRALLGKNYLGEVTATVIASLTVIATPKRVWYLGSKAPIWVGEHVGDHTPIWSIWVGEHSSANPP